ncbi:MAG: DUF2922 domain-containing protein [Schwartzia sp.]|nr:DUF2922 domain-containing protein [Schwartzia sp. (in: firmicutes)]
MTKTLNMRFLLDNGRTTAMTIADPKNDLTRATVEPVMQSIVDKSAIAPGDAVAVGIKSAVIREVNETKLI